MFQAKHVDLLQLMIDAEADTSQEQDLSMTEDGTNVAIENNETTNKTKVTKQRLTHEVKLC